MKQLDEINLELDKLEKSILVQKDTFDMLFEYLMTKKYDVNEIRFALNKRMED